MSLKPYLDALKEGVSSDINARIARSMEYAAADRFSLRLLLGHFLALLTFLAVRFSNWLALPPENAAYAFLLGAAALGLPAALHGRLGSHYRWRLLLTAAFVAFSYLFVYVSGGAVEMRFHLFIIMGYLAVYADWRLEAAVFLLILAHQVLLLFTEGTAVLLYTGVTHLTLREYGGPVLFSVILTSVAARMHRGTVVALEAARAEAQDAADRDPLTGLETRRRFMRRLETMRGGAIFFLDLDKFKQVNDTLGHAAGDAALRVASLRFKGVMRAGDGVARLGGDEFAAACPNIRTQEEASEVAARIFEAFAGSADLGGQQVRLGVSIGIALLPAGGTLEGVGALELADAAMYRAKQAGRGTVRVAGA